MKTPATEPVEPSSLCGFDALMTSTVALMTMWAEAAGDSDERVARRDSLARRIVSHLFVVAHHPHAPGLMRAALGEAHAHWVSLVHGSAAGEAPRHAGRLH